MSLEDFDRRYRYLNLATFRRSGAEVKTPIWFAVAGNKIYAYTAGKAGKAKRLRHSTRARIAPCDVRGRVLGEWRDTSARIVSDPPLVEQARAALREKYGLQIALLTWVARLAGTIRDRVYIEIDY